MESIAVVGLGCRFPGGANNPELFWQLLHEGVDAVKPIPKERWDIDDYKHLDKPGSCQNLVKEGGFLDFPVDHFDHQFFGISPREAEWMDPQQRLLLEVAWESLEDAGIDPTSLYGSKTGIFIGVSCSDYEHLITRSCDESNASIYWISGNSFSVLAGRIAYTLGLHGPAWAVDSSCSSSLVSVHQACKSLQNNESDIAIAGGVNLMLTPDHTLNLSNASLLANDFRCKAFDEYADGFIRSEGLGLVVLKRLSVAIKDKDRIYAVVAGSNVNQDGASNGITSPNEIAQENVIRLALEDAGLKPIDIDAIESHGTGTQVGDPIEGRALTKVFRQKERAKKPLIVTSVKSRMGHLESASGIAGFIKTVLSLSNQEIPANLHFTKLNKATRLDQIPAIVPTQNQEWNRSKNNVRRCGVSSFGMSGTNAHIIVEEAPLPTKEESVDRTAHIVTLSAKTESALNLSVNNYKEFISKHPEVNLKDLAHTANTGRSHFAKRLSIVASDKNELKDKLEYFNPDFDLASNNLAKSKIAFLFSGQGSIHSGMAKELYQSHPVFSDCIDRLSNILKTKGVEHSLKDAIYNKTDLLSDPVYAQTTLFAIEYAVTKLLESFGIAPDIILGHSLGEYAAAAIAGSMSEEEALLLVLTRAKLCRELKEDCGMLAIQATEQETAKLIADYKHLEIAAINSSEQTVVSGKLEDLNKLYNQVQSQALRAKLLPITHAFHSKYVDPILDGLEKEANNIVYEKPKLTWISSVTGEVQSDKPITGNYWVKNTRSAVQYDKAIEAALELGCKVFFEVGPQPHLCALGADRKSAGDALWLPCLRQDQDSWKCLLESIGTYYMHGGEIDWHGFDSPYNRSTLSLPTYPFQRSKHWLGFLEKGQMQSRQTNSTYINSIGTSPSYKVHFAKNVWQEEGSVPLRNLNTQALPSFDKQSLYNDLKEILEDQKDIEKLQLYQALCSKLDSNAYLFIWQAFIELGVEPKPGYKIDLDKLIESNQIDKRHRRFLSLLLNELTKDGYLKSKDNHYIVDSVPQTNNQQELLDSLFKEHPEFNIELTLFHRGGSNLASLLKGEEDPLALLFPPKGSISAQDFYTHSPLLKTANTVLKKSVKNLLSKLPKDKTLRILEVGSGTGATTSHILPCLPANRTEYTFTDVSPVFLEAASERFKQFDFVRYDLLDAELDPKVQGFAPAQFDIVIASNALHATCDLTEAVNNMRHLIAPGGYLLLIEGIARRLWSDVTFGTLKGWWRFNDLELRPEHLLINDKSWHKLLSQEGFSDIEIILPEGKEQSVILAQADNNPRVYPLNKSNPNSPWIIFSDDKKRASTIAQKLINTGLSAITVISDSQTEKIDRFNYTIDAKDVRAIQKLFENFIDCTISGILQLSSTSDDIAPLEQYQEKLCGSIISLSQALEEANLLDSSKLAIVTKGALGVKEDDSISVTQATLTGLAKSIEQEHPQLNCKLIDLNSNIDETNEADYIFAELFSNSPSDQTNTIAIRENVRYSEQSKSLDELNDLKQQSPDQPIQIVSNNTGDITILAYDAGLRLPSSNTRQNSNSPFGFSGNLKNGSNNGHSSSIIGIALGSLADSSAATDQDLTVAMPKTLTHKEAAALPTDFVTAYLCLHHLAKLKEGMSILIHNGANNTGLVAVLMALKANAKVYSTASNKRQKEYLSRLGVENIYDSQSTDFEKEIKTLTNGKGVDIVLNSLTGKYTEASLNTLSDQGHFIELGVSGAWTDDEVKQAYPTIKYTCFDLAKTIKEDKTSVTKALLQLGQWCEDRNNILPPVTAIKIEEGIEAFDALVNVEQIGKTVATTSSCQKNIFNAKATYIVSGGCGKLGLALTNWLVQNGAKHICLLVKHKPSKKAELQVNKLRSQGIEILTYKTDVSSKEILADTLTSVRKKMPPIKGIFHTADIQFVSKLTNHSWSTFNKALEPKMYGAWNLHELSLKDNIDHFVMFAASNQGSGHSSSNTANSYLKALAQYRNSIGLKALSVELDSKMISANPTGSIQQTAKVVDALNTVLDTNQACHIIFSLVHDTLVDKPSNGYDISSNNQPSSTTYSDSSLTSQSTTQIVESQVRYVLKWPQAEHLDSALDFAEIGMDSLMVVELANRLQKYYKQKAKLTTASIYRYSNIEKLSNYLEEQLKEHSYPAK